jgi:phosphoglycerate dehydrogenase-like enzyme
MLSRMRLGVVGLGRLGSRVADYGLGFDMQVGGYSPTSRKPDVTPFASLPELLGWADIVSLHANHTPQTERMCDAAFFAAMRPGSFFVNTARGELVDEAALLAALESGHLGGAGLDVLAGMHRPDFSECVADHPLVRYARDNTNLLLTPYYAGATRDAWQATQMRTAELLAAGMEEAMEERC